MSGLNATRSYDPQRVRTSWRSSCHSTLPTRSRITVGRTCYNARRRPSGLNATEKSLLRSTHGLPTSRPVATFQIRAVPSSEPVTTRLPLRSNAAALTGPTWPVSSTNLPVSVFQIRAVRSSDAVTTCDPSGLNAAALTGPPCPLQFQAYGCRHVPDPGGAVVRCGDHVRSIRAERGGPDRTIVAPQLNGFAGPRFIDPGRAVVRCGDDALNHLG